MHGVCLQQDKSDVPNLELSQVVAGLRAIEEPGKETLLGARLSPGMLLPTDTERWWRYAGSLTTPGCDQVPRLPAASGISLCASGVDALSDGLCRRA